jgi:hypothetical protein
VQRFRLFERGQVLALEVLDQRDLDDFVVVDLADDDRDVAKADLHGRLVAPLAGDDLEPGSTLADDDRLDDALLGDRRHELRQVPHDLPGLIRIGIDLVDRHDPANGSPRGAGQRLDVVLVVPHPDGFGKTSLRHGP